MTRVEYQYRARSEPEPVQRPAHGVRACRGGGSYGGRAVCRGGLGQGTGQQELGRREQRECVLQGHLRSKWLPYVDGESCCARC